MELANYYNDFDSQKRYDEVLFRADRVAQSREVNVMQSALIDRVSGIAQVLFKDGDIARDARCIVSDDGHALCEAGVVYIKGRMRGVAPATLTIPTVGTVNIGIYLVERVVTEIEDATLYNPAVGTRGYGEPGAARLCVDTLWGYDGDGQDGEFFPVYAVDDGVLRFKEPPPNLDGVTQAIARYDRDSAGGSYVVEGLDVTMLPDMPDGTQVYSVDEGRARINGYAVTIDIGRRVPYPASPDVREVLAEPHQSVSEAAQRINLDNVPVKQVTRVSITAKRTVNITHGSFVGASDAIPDASVLDILEVKQGGTTYTKTTDYKLTAGQVDWSPGGAEPSIASSYTITYTYMKVVEPTAVDSTGLTVTGAVVGSLVMIDYKQMLPRIDRLLMDQNGQLSWMTGVSALRNPKPPVQPATMLLLASVMQTWGPGRHITQDGIRVTTMQDLAEMRERQAQTTIDLADIRLSLDAQGRDVGIKRGLFADPMLNDSMRDAGIPQTSVIAKGALALPLSVQVHQIGADIQTPVSAAHAAVTLLSQTLRTGEMNVNPYQAFAPMPSAVTLKPAVDRWMTTETVKGPTIYQELYTTTSMRSLAGRTVTDYKYPDWVGTSDTEIEFLRQIDVEFEVRGMGPGEGLASVTFDGITVVPAALQGGTLLANPSGTLKGKFQIPPNVKAGVKEVVFVGTGGSSGQQVFSGQGTARTVTKRRMIVTQHFSADWSIDDVTLPNYFICSPAPAGCHPFSVDPLAQTFTLSEAAQVAGVDLWFTAKSTHEVLVQIRETDNGVPSQTVVLDARVPASQIKTDGTATRITWPPYRLEAGKPYALTVLCDDPVTAIAVAELGKWDTSSQKWVTSQPYQVGVLLSSSNAETWTAHQDKDMAFRLLSAQYSETEKYVDLGTIAVAGMTDFVLMGYAETPTIDAECRFEVELPDGSKTEVVDGQIVSLAEAITGDVHVRARLIGNSRSSAVLYPGIQFIEARQSASSDYISRAINADGGTKLRVFFDGMIPSGASVTVEYQGNGDAGWTAVPYLSSTLNGTTVREYTHQATIAGKTSVRLRIRHAGTPAARPAITNLRAVVL